MVIRKITVVDERLVQSDKRVCTARMPDPALRRIAVVTNPDVSLEILQPVILYNIISIPDEFENDQVLAVRDDECFLLAQRRVILEVEPVAALVGELEDVVFLQNLLRYSQLFGDESESSNTAAFAVTSVPHLHKRL